MEKTTIKEIVNDLKAKRDALSLAHEQLKKDNDDWNKCIIVLSLATGMIESAKIKMGWNSNGMVLLPIIMSSIIASISALIKFKKFPEQMETLIQSLAMLTNTLNKFRNHTELDEDILIEYHMALEKLETSVYPDIRKKYLRLSHRNLIDIMKIEQKYFKNIELVNKGETLIDFTSDKEGSETSDNINNSTNTNSFFFSDMISNKKKNEFETKTKFNLNTPLSSFQLTKKLEKPDNNINNINNNLIIPLNNEVLSSTISTPTFNSLNNKKEAVTIINNKYNNKNENTNKHKDKDKDKDEDEDKDENKTDYDESEKEDGDGDEDENEEENDDNDDNDDIENNIKNKSNLEIEKKKKNNNKERKSNY